MTPTLLGLAAVTVLAYAVKAATGFGPALVVVSLGSLLVGPVNAVILAAFLDLASGIGLAWMDRRRIRSMPWIGPAATMAAGATTGALLLDVVPTAGLGRMVGLGVVAFGLWMLVAPASRLPAAGAEGTVRPWRGPVDRWLEHGAAALGGVSGGLIGVGGPPLIIFYSAHLGKLDFRAMIVPVLLAAALFRAGTYAATGQVTEEIATLVLITLPGLPVGLWLGNHLFVRVPEQAFRRVVATVVTVVGLRLLF